MQISSIISVICNANNFYISKKVKRVVGSMYRKNNTKYILTDLRKIFTKDFMKNILKDLCYITQNLAQCLTLCIFYEASIKCCKDCKIVK